MPVKLYSAPVNEADPDGAWTCSLVAFHPADGERLYFSWSHLTLNGPGITRTGIGPPSMRTTWSLNEPWGTTDDAELMRNWSYYIDEDGLKIEELLGMDPQHVRGLTKECLDAVGMTGLLRPGDMPCGREPGAALRQIYTSRSHAARNLKRPAVHTVSFGTRFPEKTLVGQVGCGDTTMNLWHVACVQDAEERTFLYLEAEPIHDRVYPCLVGWKNRPDRPVSFEEAVRVSPGIKPGIWINDKEETEAIDFVVSGKPLLSSAGEPIPLNQVTHFFADLRHLFSLPKLTPTTEIGGPVVMFGREVTGDLWLGEKQLLDDVNLQRAACRGPVLLDRLYGGLSVTASYLENVLRGAGYRKKSGGPVEWKPGDFRIDREGTAFEIYFKEAAYPWNILAVGEYGKGENRSGQSVMLSFVCGGLSGRAHFTLRRAIDELRRRADEHNIDLKGAVLLDEGGDVFQKVDYNGTGALQATPLDPLPYNGVLACQRRLVRCCFFFAKD